MSKFPLVRGTCGASSQEYLGVTTALGQREMLLGTYCSRCCWRDCWRHSGKRLSLLKGLYFQRDCGQWVTPAGVRTFRGIGSLWKYCSAVGHLRNCSPWMTHTGGETFRNMMMWKPEEAKRRRKMSKMPSTLVEEVGESKKRVDTPISTASSHLIVQQRWKQESWENEGMKGVWSWAWWEWSKTS